MKAMFIGIALVAGISLVGSEPAAAFDTLKSTLADCRESAVRFYNSVR